MRVFAFFLILFSFIGTFGRAQDFSLYESKTFVAAKDTLLYRMMLPEGYKPGKKYPLIVFLHGSGERGNDNAAQLTHGGKFFMQDSIRRKYPAIVVFPQCPANDQWTTIEGRWDSTVGRRIHYFLGGVSNKPAQLTTALIQKMIADKKINTQRIYLGGLSLGGFGTFVLAAEHPGLFAAAFPICGGGDVNLSEKYNPKTAWWLFHGAKDDVVDPEYSRRFYKELQRKKFNVRYTEYPEANHDSWTDTFKEPQLMAWMFGKKLR